MNNHSPLLILNTRTIAFMVFPGFNIQDLSGPLATFEAAGKSAAGTAYRCHVVSSVGGLVASSSGVPIMTDVVDQDSYDTFVVIGGVIPTSSQVVRDLARIVTTVASGSTRRIASVCTGAFLLAKAGLLDGKRATTHWKYTALLQREFPKINVLEDPIFTKDGRFWTSAGVTAGIDLALAMIEEDLGPVISNLVARNLVVYHRRPGGQSQFSALGDMEPRSSRIREVLTYIREHLDDTLSTDHLASIACLSTRQFGRAFLAETGETPAKAVERLRVEVAKQRVQHGAEPIEVIARHVGFSDPDRMRRAFIRMFGHCPNTIRRMTITESPTDCH
ncbi:GlxA family transcriptional regulator [Paraburkholderia caribensis]|uniref:GlxA family transcriptional regulator n=1 Tax=Paraburkholderia caribensis TaxID=75105 RepID=UPI00078EA43D|nr:GlxA family transcriptional regulator [Paraburkholderia caribensis]AMV48482.1 AraC family transcriptional regulator [Paraburkholderia caribensis]